MAMCAASRESQYLRSMLTAIGIGVDGPTHLWGDNQGAIALVKNPAHHERTKHIDVQYHFIRSLAERGDLIVGYVPTEDMVADIFTKPLPKAKFERDCARIGLRNPTVRTYLVMPHSTIRHKVGV